MAEERMVYCPNCGADLPIGARFCPTCGKDLQARYVPTPPIRVETKDPLSAIKDLVRSLGTVATIILLAYLGLCSATMVWGIGEVLPKTNGEYTRLFVITPWITEIVRLYDEGFAVFYLLMVGAILASFAWLLYRSIPGLKKELKFKEVDEHSPAYTMATLFFALFFFNLAFYLMVELLGGEANSPNFDEKELWTNLYGFVRASVWEELIVRVLYIGVPLFAIDLLLKRRERRARTYVLGGGFSIGATEVGLVLFSSFMFAAAHSFSWDLYKTIPTFIGGLAFGYLFLRFGLYASIMLHFTFDYLSMPIDALNNGAFDIMAGLFILGWALVGMAYFVMYTKRAVEFALPFAVRTKEKKVQEVYEPSFSRPCPYCGEHRARLLDGELECLNCGRRY
jgi:hypothetical protein